MPRTLNRTDAARLTEFARLHYGAARSEELASLAATLVAGLEIVADADLGNGDEPDFLDSQGPE